MEHFKGGQYGRVLREEKQYLLIMAANMISRFGDSIDAIAYSWLVYGLTGSKAWLAVTFGVNMIPTILFQPLGGALTEFLDKKAAVVTCDILRGLVVCLTGVLFLTGQLMPWQLLAMTFLNSCLEALRIPNGLAIIPSVLKKENYKTGISLNQGVSRVSELVGFGAAGVVIGWLGNGGALLVDAATFLASGVILWFLRLKKKTGIKNGFSFERYWKSLKEGFRYFKNSKISIMVCMICVILNVTLIPIENLQAAYVSEYLKLGVSAMSVGSTSMTLGTIAGSFLLPQVTKRISDRTLLISGGTLIGLLYFIYVLIGKSQGMEVKVFCYGLTAFTFGFINSLIGVAVQVLFITRLPEDMLGRIGGIFSSLACSFIPVSSFVLAGASIFFSIREIYTVMGAATIAAFILVLNKVKLE